jgi:hypothetical protein
MQVFTYFLEYSLIRKTINQNIFCCNENVLQIVSIKIIAIKGNIRSVALNIFSTRDSEVLMVLQTRSIVVVSFDIVKSDRGR